VFDDAVYVRPVDVKLPTEYAAAVVAVDSTRVFMAMPDDFWAGGALKVALGFAILKWMPAFVASASSSACLHLSR
jgi:hypothetical protein